MKVVIAPDSFKESLSAPQAAEAIRDGILAANPQAEPIMAPVADGGEGTVEAVVASAGGRFLQVTVPDPLGRPVDARIGLLDCSGAGAVIEMAAASGLHLLAAGERNPLKTSTRGTGAMIRGALDAGARRIMVGAGGSATVDCGTGMAAELGVRFIDSSGKVIERPAGADMERIERIDTDGLDERIADCELVVASDVSSPLTGPDGAARVYGPQKGAGPAAVERLEKGLEHLSGIIRRDTGVDVSALPGGGAAGGLGAGLAALAGARIESGIGTVMEAVGLEDRIKGCDLVITGEGKADFQSAFGKAPAGVGGLAKKHGVPAIVLAGILGEGCEELYNHGISAAFSIASGPMTLQEAVRDAPALLRRTAESVIRLWASSKTLL